MTTRRERLARRVIDGHAGMVAAWGRAAATPATRAKVWTLYCFVILTGFFALWWWVETSQTIKAEHDHLRHGLEVTCHESQVRRRAAIAKIKSGGGAAVYLAVSGPPARKRAATHGIQLERIEQIEVAVPQYDCAARAHLFTK